MKSFSLYSLAFFIVFNFAGCQSAQKAKTVVSFENEKILINDIPTLKGRIWNGIDMEGLLPNSRMVQCIFDDENKKSASRWIYPDTRLWDADRNTNEFIDAMEAWRKHGLIGITLNLQGGSPEGYSAHQPWINSAFDANGGLKKDYMSRLEKILIRADELEMVVILGLFYFGQDENIKDDEAVKNAVSNSVNWILEKGFRNVIIEIANECDNAAYQRSIIHDENIHELILLAKSIRLDGRQLLVSTSFNGNQVPTDHIVKVSDFILMHGNGVENPERIKEMVSLTRALPSYRPMPIIFNEDDHYDFNLPANNMIAAFESGASWGFFDFRRKDESFNEGYQSVPVDWGISSERKKAFFYKLKEITGY